MAQVEPTVRAAAFHAGERLLQERVGKAGQMAEIGARVIRDHMPEQHRSFFAQLPFVVLAAADAQGRPCATLLAGVPGFVSSPDSRSLRIAALPGDTDPLAGAIRVGAMVGLLGLEPPTRRRNRMNGRVSAVDEGGFSVEVRESFGNCPKYIQARSAEFVGGGVEPAAPVPIDPADPLLRRVVGAADTLFIATAHPAAADDTAAIYGADVSHRGGKPGFVRWSQAADGGVTLTLPDFAGNNFFNTLGNIVLDPRVGLLFVDVDGAGGDGVADLIHFAGMAEIVEDGPEVAAFAGAQRLLRIHVERAALRRRALPLRWGKETEPSPFLEGTGTW
ncbi:flavin-nucleotide-binding protein [Azoarcus sp. DD4]|uniref:pyridoxamine 5'-phosphate oxidase family protein n=1 Tax=Azoarcus sp. DD4 TaxID=2027405 RepID=UPI001128A7C3|nr:pyridoxamine 5'-phosphate oxidase family protein [Azoarcus sp. DD4]QDF99573.1 flavin-nucleotide-binding protein [Azoarcus sp. DD4]